MLENKQIVVGVTGGIAGYKAAELVRLLVREGANTKVAMTEHATKFISPLTFEALSGNQVITYMFSQQGVSMAHITWAQDSDLIVIAPATANFIAKMAHGISDDFLSTMVVAATAPVLVCPAMNNRMYENPVVQENLETLKKRGIHVMEPATGQLACRSEGRGRLPEPPAILESIEALVGPQDLKGLRVMVTAGPTVEPIDPVRFISNRSSGKMGYAVARVARARGAQVLLITGPSSVQLPSGLDIIRVKTAEEMKDAVLSRAPEFDAVIMAAAVVDYRPKHYHGHKIKKDQDELRLELERTPDILKELGSSSKLRPRVLVGFAAETEALIEHAKEKLTQKNLDMIVANDVSRSDAGFEVDTNLVKLIYRDGTIEELPLMAKEEVASQILDRVRQSLQ